MSRTAKVEVLVDEEVNSSGDTSHTVYSGLRDKCSRTNTPRKDKDVERTEEIGGRRQQFKRISVDATESKRGVLPGLTRGAVLISGEEFKPVVSLDHDYDAKHRGRSMYSEDAKVSTAKKTNIIRDISGKSHRFQKVHTSGKSPMVSPVKVDIKRRDNSGNLYYVSKGNHNVGSSQKIAPLWMRANRRPQVRNGNHHDQHIPLRSEGGDCKGSESQQEERFRCVVPEDTTRNKLFPQGKRQISAQTTRINHTQPMMLSHRKGKQQCKDRMHPTEADNTGYDYMGRMLPPSAEKLNESPIRYTTADGRRFYWVEVTNTEGVINQTNKRGNEHQMSVRTSERAKSRNPSRYDHGYSTSFVKNKGTFMSKDWDSNCFNKPANSEADNLRSTPNPEDRRCAQLSGMGRNDPDHSWRLEELAVNASTLIMKRVREKQQKRTSVSVLQEVHGKGEPQWIKLNTDQGKKDQGSISITGEEVRPLPVRGVDLTKQMEIFKLNPNANCFTPNKKHGIGHKEEETMVAEIEDKLDEGEGEEGKTQLHKDGERESESPLEKEEKKKEPPLVWNLKGRSVDDILRDLDDLKNDPDIPMPIIEADIAPAEDFEQYAKNLKAEDCTDDTGAVDEMSKDLSCLEALKELTGQALDNMRPQAFPIDFWPFVINEQKVLVKERWAGYDQENLKNLVEIFLGELQVSNERPYATPYFVAQALANMDRFVIKSKDGVPPLIHEKYTHRMELLPGTRVRKELPQRFSENQNAFLKAKLSILEEQGRIKQKEGLRKEDWLHRIVLVEHPTRMAAFRLKHGDNTQQAMNDPANRYEVSQLYRLTVDCREINKCLAVEPYPMPENSMGKENIIGSRYMSTSDAADAFYAVPIREIDYGKTGFTALNKQWVFTVMLQGGINSARHFARIITDTFDGVPQSKILAFQDDALVHALRLLQALLNQQLLYDCIRSNDIMLKPSKTRIGFSSCKFLGHIYTPMGRLPDPTRVESIINMDAKPKTQKEVRHIVGLLVWNIEYIPNGMGILSYLSDLVRKDADVVTGWKPEVQGKALDLLKAALASAPCLRPIDIKRPFRVHVDACKNGRGIGAVLLQEYNGKWRPCSYFSKALTPAQRQWSATELEAYALVSAARHWERYLQNGHKWTAIVDHKALIYLVVKRTRTNNTRLLNSVMCLQGHYFDILHRNGEEHFDADAVSRILQSGDIQEAQEAVDIEDDYDKSVTMKDIYLLNRLLQLQLMAGANARGDSEVRMPMNPDAKVGPDKQVALVERIKKSSKLSTKGEPTSVPVFLETNMALTDKRDKLDTREGRKEPGLIEAQEKAKEAKERLQKHKRDQDTATIVSSSDQYTMGSSSSSSLHKQTSNDGDEDHDKDYDDNGTGAEQVDPYADGHDDDDEGNDDDHSEGATEPKIMIPVGPFRWTTTVIREFMSEYRPLEGRMLLHPRTGRLYEVGTVFFYDKLKIAAAYIRAIDGGQADPLDEHPHRIDGKGGLLELVQAFEKSGGSSGKSRTPWPTSETEWLAEQKRDPMWQGIIEEMESELRRLQEEQEKTGQSNSSSSSSSSSELRSQLPIPTQELTVEQTHRGIHLIFNGALLVKQPTYDHEEYRLLYVVPESLQRNVMELYHDSKGHPGAARTKETIHLYYWWKGMSYMVMQHIYGCKACARRKARNAVAAAPVQAYNAPTIPWERAHIDLTGPLTESSRGNKYIVVVKDALTRYVEAIPIRNKSADEVVHAFISTVVYRHGAVGWLISDNGREFVNKFFAQVAQLLNIKHTTITEYNPRANGLAENHMRTMKDALSIYCDESQKDWDSHLRGVTMSYNTTINSQTGFTPYFMLYGREARMPSEAWMKGFKHTSGVLPYITELVKGLTAAWESAASKKPAELKRMQEGQKPIRHLQFAEYKVGEYAMVANTPKSQNIGWVDAKFRKLNLKLQPRYSGPYLISRQISPVVYVLKVDGFDMKVHAVNMKPFTGRKNTLTPYAEPGFDRYQANERVAPKPLLLSPDQTLNESARVRFKKKSPGRLRLHTESVNKREQQSKRERELKDSISASQDDDYVVEGDLELEEANDDASYGYSSDDHLSSSTSKEVGQSSSSSRNTSFPTTNETNSAELEYAANSYNDTVMETNMTHTECPEEPDFTSWEKDFHKRARNVSERWGKTIDRRNRHSRDRILNVAGISEVDLELNDEMKQRVEIWMDDLIVNEQSRRSRLSRAQLIKESFSSSMEENIGRQLHSREQQWQHRPIHLRTNASAGETCFQRRISSTMDTPSIPQGKCRTDHIPEEFPSSRLTLDHNTQIILEECNLLNVEVWSDTDTHDDKAQDDSKTDEDDSSISSEDSFDREQWHRSVLKACTYHASRLDLGKYQTLSFETEDQRMHRLRVELDADIPVPIQYRTLWHQLQSDIRRFGYTGLLFPVVNNTLDNSDRWRNHSTQNNRHVPQSIYVRVLSIPVRTLKSLFHPDLKGRVILSTDEKARQTPTMDGKDIHRKYDHWYWKAMRVARRMEMEPSSPRRAYSRLRGHSRREANMMNASEWRAHHYFMWDAIQRNKNLREPPQWLSQEVTRC